MRRGSSGSADEAALTVVARRLCLPLAVGLALGVTTGNRVDRLPGVTVVFGSPGKVIGGSTGADADEGNPISVVIVAWAGDIPSAVTVSVTVICSPVGAVEPMCTLTSNSMAWRAGSEPMEHSARRAAGHRVNRGRQIECPRLLAVAVTRCDLDVLQTQMAYVICPPGTFDVLLPTICVATQISPGLGVGDGDGLGERDPDGLGVGVGVGDGLVELVELGD